MRNIIKDNEKNEFVSGHNFCEVIDRANTNTMKWNCKSIFGEDDVLPFWVADMDFKSPQPVIDSLANRAEHGIYGYTLPGRSYKESITNWITNRHNWEVNQDWILTLPTLIYGITLIMRTFSNVGDQIVIQQPVYHPFARIVNSNQRELSVNELVYENGSYKIDFDDLEQRLANPKTKIFLLCSPHNPVGRVWTKDELKQMGELCLKHDVFIISDEIHWDLVFADYKHIPTASISEEIANITFTCTAPTKTFNLAGLHISNLIISCKQKRKQIITEINNAGLNDNNIFGLIALEAAYTHGERWLVDLMVYLHRNLQLIEQHVQANWPAVKLVQLEGTYLAWLDIKSTGASDEEIQKRLVKEAKVALHMGSTFGQGGEGFLRMNFACPHSMLKIGLQRMDKVLK
ncbi:MalY/PatB family protein [Desulfuribacillus alkaliarsenatis]|uniref:cysteine-S-conjugate beta-lyase n=1 Tax=Desulfuribacillus alkaliarsenatis TaxID=766136 RepID=A0A1E5G163_9FIRM|nr:MalY/PatB family protein [Desulfuribacillus alkaliarsenatis]OEF96601.1 hypothetical protein BHF68_08125 [Desulfuribacillus alkaliarsenatis]